MRVFIAVELDEAVRHRAAAIASRLAGDIERSRRPRAVTWVAPRNLHLTMKFIGEVEPAVVDEVAARLAPVFATPAFEIGLSGVGTFPPSGPPRVIFLTVVQGGAALAELFKEIETRLDGMGLPREDRPFRAHLTLGRVKAPLGPHVGDSLSRLAGADAGRCLVRHVTLFESRLSPQGPTYREVAVSTLREP